MGRISLQGSKTDMSEEHVQSRWPQGITCSSSCQVQVGLEILNNQKPSEASKHALAMLKLMDGVSDRQATYH